MNSNTNNTTTNTNTNSNSNTNSNTNANDLSTFFALDVPNGLEFGLNLMEFEAGPKFKGIGMIPHGLQFVYYSCGMGLRQGYFIKTMKNDVFVRNWDVSIETLSIKNNLSEESNKNFLNSLYTGQLNDSIGCYNTSEHHIWENLTKFITNTVLIRSDCMVPTSSANANATSDK